MEEIKKLTYFLHTMMCDSEHAVDMKDIDNEKLCCFYIEETLEDPWIFKDHKDWLAETERFVEIASPHGTLDVVKALTKVNQIFEMLKKADARLTDYLIQIIMRGD